MRDVAVIGAGMGHRWGKYSGSLIEMMSESALETINDAGTDELDAVFVANMGA